MSVDKYPSIFSRQMEAIVNVYFVYSNYGGEKYTLRSICRQVPHATDCDRTASLCPNIDSQERIRDQTTAIIYDRLYLGLYK